MKRLILMALFLAIPVDALAQKAVVSEKPNMFSTLEACERALESGNFHYYVPKFYGLNSREPVNGVERVIVPLEADTCLEMQVAVKGRWFVVQKEGELFRGRRLADGSVALYARNDCGNRVQGVVFPAPAVAFVEPEPEPERRLVIRENFPPPPVEREREYVEPEKKGRKKWPWLLAGGLLAGGYATYYYWPCPDGMERDW